MSHIVKRILDAVHDYQQRKPEYTPAWALELQIQIGARRGEIAPLRRCDITDRYISITREQITGELLRLTLRLEVGASCFNHYCIGYDYT